MVDSFLFIVGVGRSGTSLLQSMLNAHSEIIFLPEINFIRRFIVKNGLKIIQDNTELIQFISDDKRLKRLNMDFSDIFRNKVINRDNIGLYTYQQILNAYIDGNDITYVGDKDPRSIEFIPTLQRIFPDVKIIHIIRDPRDVLLSKMKAGWSKQRPLLYNVFAGVVQIELVHLHKKSLNENIIELHYENLIQYTLEELQKICTDLKLQFESGMLDFQVSAQKLISEDEIEWKKETLRPVIAENAEKWKQGLTNWQIQLVEELNPAAFRYYRYEKSQPRITIFQIIYLKILAIPFRIMVRLYCKYRVWSQ